MRYKKTSFSLTSRSFLIINSKQRMNQAEPRQLTPRLRASAHQNDVTTRDVCFAHKIIDVSFFFSFHLCETSEIIKFTIAFQFHCLHFLCIYCTKFVRHHFSIPLNSIRFEFGFS